MKTRESQIEFMRLNGERLAACGWAGYMEKGRGMVCVLSDLENELLLLVPFDFIPEADAAKLFKPWDESKESRMVAGYDPRMEVVICFGRCGANERGEIDSYRIKTRPAPPAAAEA